MSAFFFIQLTRNAPKLHGLTATQSSVLRCVGAFAHPETGEARLSIARMMEVCVLSESTVKAALGDLRRLGLLSSTQTGRSAVWLIHDVEAGSVTGRAVADQRQGERLRRVRAKSDVSHRVSSNGRGGAKVDVSYPDDVSHLVGADTSHLAKYDTSHPEVPSLKSHGEEPQRAAAAAKSSSNGSSRLHPLDATSSEPSRARARDPRAAIDFGLIQPDGTVGELPDSGIVNNRNKWLAAVRRWARTELGARGCRGADGCRCDRKRSAHAEEVARSVQRLGYRVTIEEIRSDLFERGVWPI